MADRLATVAVLYTLPESAIVLSVLRAYGIPAVAIPGHAASVAWHYMIAFGGIEVRVPEGEFEAAAALLALRAPDLTPPRRLIFARSGWLNALLAIAGCLLGVPPPACLSGCYLTEAQGVPTADNESGNPP